VFARGHGIRKRRPSLHARLGNLESYLRPRCTLLRGLPLSLEASTPRQKITSRKRLAINPLLSRSWFILGCACSKIEDWEEARQAFFRCVAIDDEDAESWNNLASVYLRMAEVDEQPGGEVRISDNCCVTHYWSTEYWTVPQSDRERTGDTVRTQNARLARSQTRGQTRLRQLADVDELYGRLDGCRELTEACRALARIVERRADKDGSSSVDEDVLDKLVDAATRSVAQAETEPP
jgi:tetratricopeptide (TPR) repeat protein